MTRTRASVVYERKICSPKPRIRLRSRRGRDLRRSCRTRIRLRFESEPCERTRPEKEATKPWRLAPGWADGRSKNGWLCIGKLEASRRGPKVVATHRLLISMPSNKHYGNDPTLSSRS